MNSKTIAIVVGLVVVIAALGAGIAFMNGDKSEDKEINVIARVNTQGSGIFLKSGENPADYIIYKSAVTSDEKYIDRGESAPAAERYIVFNTANWGGKIFGTPGTATIQHVQLQDLVQNTMKLTFKMYQDGEGLDSGTVYFTQTASYEKFDSESGTIGAKLVGCIIWEAQYSLALKNGCSGLITTNILFPEHTCCVIAAAHSYTSGHEAETERFLAAYVASVNKMHDAYNAGSGADYDKLIQVACEKVAIPDKYAPTAEDKKNVIVSAMGNVTYRYSDADGSLDALKSDVAALSTDLYNLKAITNSVSDLGFKDSTAFADRFVNDSFLKKAIEGGESLKSSDKMNITVAVIAGDVHQLAIHYGMATGVFESYGINIEISSQTNGPGVATALQNGGAEFGFLGAPPITITVMNSSLVTN